MPENILSLTRDEVVQRVREALRWHRGETKKIARWELVEQVYGHGATLDRTNNNPYDRVVREVISEYRDIDLIVSTTQDGGGYWLAESIKEAEIIAADYVKRSRVMELKARNVRKRAVETFGPQIPLL